MTCSTCSKWFVRKETHYGNGEVIINWQDPPRGRCRALDFITTATFECNQYEVGVPIVEVIHKDGEPWHHWVIGPCPKCNGNGVTDNASPRVDDQCCGTGKVRYYDDGFIGENRTYRHPKETVKRDDAPTPTCFNCHKSIGLDWLACPYCGTRFKETKPEPEQVLL